MEKNTPKWYTSDWENWIALKFSEIKKYKIVKILGKGQHGTAYLTDDKKVIKVTTDRSEFIESKKLVGKNPKHLSKIYDAYTVKSNNHPINDVWVIVTEFLKHNSQKQDMLSENLDRFWRNSDELIEISGYENYMPVLFAYQVGKLENETVKQIFNILRPNPNIFNYFTQLITILDEMKIYGVNSVDYGPFNLGYRGNILVYFDLGFGDWHEVTDNNIIYI